MFADNVGAVRTFRRPCPIVYIIFYSENIRR